MRSQRGITSDFRGFFVLTFRELSVAVVWSSDPWSVPFSLSPINSSEPSEPEEESAAAFLFVAADAAAADAAAAPFAAVAAFLARATAPLAITKAWPPQWLQGLP